jgi:uncharacterized 2Fe-2S/4Fe-4S cluster protein (DUF4445 family)
LKRKVVFLPEEVSVEVLPGTPILRAAALAGIEVKSSCGGKGSCSRCLVKVEEGKAIVKSTGKLSTEEQEQGYVLSCQALVDDQDLRINVPISSRLEEHRILFNSTENVDGEEKAYGVYDGYPLCTRFQLALEPPSIDDNTSDLTRLRMALRREMGKNSPETEININIAALRGLANAFREGNWKVSVVMSYFLETAEVITVAAGQNEKPLYGLAIDIGTTTVAIYLIDLLNGKTVLHHGSFNRQSRYGDDIISRIIYASEEEKGLDELHDSVISTINEIIGQILQQTGINEEEIFQVVAAGNTTMTHLFLGVPPDFIRLEPYIPAFSSTPAVKAKDLGLRVHPEAWVHSFPQVASYLGGDIVSGILYADLAANDEIVLFVDIGTNGEIVLGNKDWMVGCACSAGPSFEGGGITFGMRAMSGAIERVLIDPVSLEVQVKTVNNAKPMGICGSGLIDCLSALKTAGIIDRSGKFHSDLKSTRLRSGEEGLEYVLVWAEDSGSETDIVLTEGDVKNLIRAKGAVYAAIRTLLRTLELDESVITKVIIAGGFGNYLHIKDAIRIGLLPDLEYDKFEFIGNSSLKGARLGLLSRKALDKAREIGNMITYIELSVGTIFMDEYVSALFLPHTDITLFPSVESVENRT